MNRKIHSNILFFLCEFYCLFPFENFSNISIFLGNMLVGLGDDEHRFQWRNKIEYIVVMLMFLNFSNNIVCTIDLKLQNVHFPCTCDISSSRI